MSTIPASQLVSVTPGVLGAGGTGVTGTGLMLTTSSRVPIGSVQSFNSQPAVASYFGAASAEAAEAAIYFGGYVNDTQTPANVLFAQFSESGAAAFLRGGNVSSLTLAQLQAINASMTVVFDGYARTGTINLSGATSFSNAAGLMQTALNSALPQEASVTGAIAATTATFTGSVAGNVLTVTAIGGGTIVNGGTLTGTGVTASTLITNQLSGTPGGIGTYAVSIAQTVASEALSETYGTLTVSAAGTPGLAVGQTVLGAGVTAGTIITQLGTGTGGTGTYFVNNTQTVASEALTGNATPITVAFDSISGAFVLTSGVTGAASTSAFATGTPAATLELTSATGAVLSQGAAAQTPAAFMNALIVQNSAWANFMTLFDPDFGSGNAQKQAFAAWKNTQNNRFGYVCWDPDASPAAQSNAASSLGRILAANNDSGTMLIWEGGAATDLAGGSLAAFALGAAASINFQQTNGRITFAFKAQAGLVANVSDPTTAGNLLANGYNFYGAYGAATQNFVFLQNGQCTGPFAWFDAYQNQIWLNTSFQVALLNLLANVGSVPFSAAGAALIQGACQTVIQAGLAFGAFGPRSMTPTQIAEVNQAAGVSIASALQANGYYLLTNLPAASVRAARGPWNIQFWYLDQGAVQTINLSSVLVQ